MPAFFPRRLERSAPVLAVLAAGVALTPLAAAQSSHLIVNPSGPAVVSLTLINADTDQPVPGYDPILPAATLDLSRLPGRLNVRANTAGKVGSVRFGLDNNASFRQENTSPYAMCGNNGGDYAACGPGVLTPGTHRISAAAYTGANGSGAAGSGVLANFTVVRPATPPAPLAVTSLTLIDADTDRPVPGYDPIPAGARLRLSALPRHLNLRANTSAGVQSVRFAQDGAAPHLENEAPFALCVDGRFRNGKKGDYFACGSNVFAPGDHRLTATPYSKMFGGGTAGPALSWTFRVDR